MEQRQLRRLARKIVRTSEEVADLTDQLEIVESILSKDVAGAEMEELHRMMTDLERQADLVPEETHIAECEAVIEVSREVPLVKHSQEQEPLKALEGLFSPEMAAQMNNESLDESLKWDAFDYAVVGTAGMMAAVTDVLLVGLPSGLVTGPVTAWMKQLNTSHGSDWFSRFARELEDRCRTSYDTLNADGPIAGMCGKTHRFQSLGHDPVLGFVFGVSDILRGTITGYSYQRDRGVHRSFRFKAPSRADVGLVEAFLLHIGHLLSDVGTRMGLPAPFTPLLQAFNCGRFGAAGLSLGEVARRMYLQGYDFRHFLAGGLSPGVAQATISGLLMLRSFATDGPSYDKFRQTLKYRRMELAAQTVAVLGNTGKVALFQGNPLALNQAQWMRFFASLGPVFKEWILRDEMRIAHQLEVNRDGWRALGEWRLKF